MSACPPVLLADWSTLTLHVTKLLTYNFRVLLCCNNFFIFLERSNKHKCLKSNAKVSLFYSVSGSSRPLELIIWSDGMNSNIPSIVHTQKLIRHFKNKQVVDTQVWNQMINQCCDKYDVSCNRKLLLFSMGEIGLSGYQHKNFLWTDDSTQHGSHRGRSKLPMSTPRASVCSIRSWWWLLLHTQSSFLPCKWTS